MAEDEEEAVLVRERVLSLLTAVRGPAVREQASPRQQEEDEAAFLRLRAIMEEVGM